MMTNRVHNSDKKKMKFDAVRANRLLCIPPLVIYRTESSTFCPKLPVAAAVVLTTHCLAAEVQTEVAMQTMHLGNFCQRQLHGFATSSLEAAEGTRGQV